MRIIYAFDLPKPVTRIAFEEFIDVKGRHLLEEATKVRDGFTQACNGGNAAAQQVLDRSVSYFGYLVALLECLEVPAGGKPFRGFFGLGAPKKGPPMAWRSCINTPQQPKPKTFSGVKQCLRFDELMVVVAIGACHMVLAEQALASVPSKDEVGEHVLQSAALSCAKAAGVFQWAAENIPESVLDEVDKAQCPEVLNSTLRGMSFVASAACQQLSYELARRKQNVNPTLLSKVAVMVAELSDKALHALKGSGPPGTVGGALMVHLSACASLYRAMAMRHVAEVEWSADHHGTAVAYCRAGASHIEKVEGYLKGATLFHLKDVLEREISLFRDASAMMEKDNSSVYFDAVPDRSTLPPVYGVVVRQSVNFVPPSKALSVQELLG